MPKPTHKTYTTGNKIKDLQSYRLEGFIGDIPDVTLSLDVTYISRLLTSLHISP